MIKVYIGVKEIEKKDDQIYGKKNNNKYHKSGYNIEKGVLCTQKSTMHWEEQCALVRKGLQVRIKKNS